MRKTRILVIEDHLLNMELAVALLESRGYAVLQAPYAGRGLALAEAGLPDLVVMDISLPDMDGLTATRILKGKENTRHIPVVALTARAMPGDRRAAMAAGCDAYVAKPIEADHFFACIEKLIQRGRESGDGCPEADPHRG